MNFGTKNSNSKGQIHKKNSIFMQEAVGTLLEIRLVRSYYLFNLNFDNIIYIYSDTITEFILLFVSDDQREQDERSTDQGAPREDRHTRETNEQAGEGEP